MELYKEHRVNPISGCLPLLIQLPILIALYRVSLGGFGGQILANIYSFIHKPDTINQISMGFIDLAKKNIPLAVVAGVAQFFQSKFSPQVKTSNKVNNGSKKPESQLDLQSMMQKQMLYFFPVLTIIISSSFPAGLPLYWITTTLFSILEQAYVRRKIIQQ